MRKTHAYISLINLDHNIRTIQQLNGSERLILMIKANAYGHGLVPIANHIKGKCDCLGVAIPEEAVILRNAEIEQNILVLEGFFDRDDLVYFIENRIWTVIHNYHQLDILIQNPELIPEKIFIKFDTGMNRLGFQPSEAEALIAKLATITNRQNLVAMTHLGNADFGNDQRTWSQTDQLESILKKQALDNSIKNSPALASLKHLSNSWSRIGLMLYGADPMSVPLDNGGLSLKPVMSLKAPIMAIRTAKQGEAVGYGNHWIAPKDTTIATVAIGYADGYPRITANGSPVYINGQIAPLAGRVSMDMLTVDVSDIEAVKIGDMVELWGKNIPVETIASAAMTSNYELLSRIGERVPRYYE